MIKVLVIGMTPGPAECLSELVTDLKEIADLLVLTSDDASYGGGARIFKNNGIQHLLVESLLQNVSLSDFPSSLAEALLDQFRPNVILSGVTPDSTGEKRFIEEAVFANSLHYGSRCLQVIDGWDSFYRRNWPTSDHRTFLVFDDQAAQLLRTEGIDDDNIRIVGYPKHLGSKRLDKKRRLSVRQHLGVPQGTRLNVSFGQVSTDNAQTLAWLARCSSDEDKILFHQHPRDGRSLEELCQLCDQSILTTTLGSEDILQAADFCTTHFSTCGFSAAALGIPTILTLLDNDAQRIRKQLGKYPTTLMGLTYEAYDFNAFSLLYDNVVPASSHQISALRRASGRFSGLVRSTIMGNYRDTDRDILG